MDNAHANIWGGDEDHGAPDDWAGLGPEAEPVTEELLALVERRFDALPAGRAWCGYGTWYARDDMRRLAVFVSHDGTRALTLTHYSGGHAEMAGPDGEIWTENCLEDILARLEGLPRLFA